MGRMQARPRIDCARNGNGMYVPFNLLDALILKEPEIISASGLTRSVERNDLTLFAARRIEAEIVSPDAGRARLYNTLDSGCRYGCVHCVPAALKHSKRSLG